MDADGRRKWTRTHATKKEAQREAGTLGEPHANRQTRPRGPNLTLGDAIALGRDDLAKTGRPAGTLRWFEGQVRVLRARWRDDLPLRLLTVAGIQAFVDHRLASVSAATVRHHLRCLKRLQRLACRAGWQGSVTARDVVVPAGRPYRPDVFGWQEAVDLLHKIRSAPASQVANRLDRELACREADLIEFLFRTGLRRAELARLALEDIDLRAKTIYVKGKRRPRTIPVSKAVCDLAKRVVQNLGIVAVHRATKLAAKNDKPLAAVLESVACDVIAETFGRWRIALGEPRLHAHACRHTFATRLVERGVQLATVARLLGHAPGSLAITSHYYGPSEPALREAIENL